MLAQFAIGVRANRTRRASHMPGAMPALITRIADTSSLPITAQSSVLPAIKIAQNIINI